MAENFFSCVSVEKCASFIINPLGYPILALLLFFALIATLCKLQVTEREVNSVSQGSDLIDFLPAVENKFCFHLQFI